jgi:hypothetical protein
MISVWGKYLRIIQRSKRLKERVMKKLLLVSVLFLAALCVDAKPIKIMIKSFGSKAMVYGSTVNVMCGTVSLSLAGFLVSSQSSCIGSFDDASVTYPAATVLSGCVNVEGKGFPFSENLTLQSHDGAIYLDIDTDNNKVAVYTGAPF